MIAIGRRALLGGGLASLAALGTGVRGTLPWPFTRGGVTDGAEQADACTFELHRLETGAGSFETCGGPGHENARIGVFYYRPSNFTPRSRILIVIPGAGRNADTYRDAWIEAAERAGVLVAALHYPEEEYGFAAYQMGGVIRDLEIRNLPVGPDGHPPASVHLRDEDISFEPNPRREEWLFGDFDRIFDLLTRSIGSTQASYDLFGHSAGGQILHRLVLFRPDSRAARIMAANAGFYTLPDLNEPQPIGLKGTGVDEASLRASFGRELIVLAGEDDNDGEEGGIQLHTPLLDRFGVDRLSRARVFHARAQEMAGKLGVGLNWKLNVVPGVGHDFRAMSYEAARMLYRV